MQKSVLVIALRYVAIFGEADKDTCTCGAHVKPLYRGLPLVLSNQYTLKIKKRSCKGCKTVHRRSQIVSCAPSVQRRLAKLVLSVHQRCNVSEACAPKGTAGAKTKKVMYTFGVKEDSATVWRRQSNLLLFHFSTHHLTSSASLTLYFFTRCIYFRTEKIYNL